MRDIFVHPSGQDDNLGDSALRAGLMGALRTEESRLHVLLEGQTSDYVAGIPLVARDVRYAARRDWLGAARSADRPVYVLNAGEINPQKGQHYPHPDRATEMREIVRHGGVVVAAGLGLKDPSVGAGVDFDPGLRGARLVSWRDHGSQQAVGFGEVAPDWAFALGPETSRWGAIDARHCIAVTLRFDRPWPGRDWLHAVRSFAAARGQAIVTVAQVARDAPRAVDLAQALGGRYLVAPSTSHDAMDLHVRSVYARSSAVISDRAHALILGATEGAYPFGTAQDPQKIKRILDAAGLGALTGHHDDFSQRAAGFEGRAPEVVGAIGASRRTIRGLQSRLRSLIAECT